VKKALSLFCLLCSTIVLAGVSINPMTGGLSFTPKTSSMPPASSAPAGSIPVSNRNAWASVPFSTQLTTALTTITLPSSVQAIYNYTQDFTINSALSGALITNLGAVKDITGRMQSREILGDKFSITVLNEVLTGAEKPTVYSVTTSGFTLGGLSWELQDGLTTWGGAVYTINGNGDWLAYNYSNPANIKRIRFYCYPAGARIRQFRIDRYDGGAWTKVPITSVGANTSIVNTDEAQYDGAVYHGSNGWADVSFDLVSDTKFRIYVLSVFNNATEDGAGDVNAGISEIEMYGVTARITIQPDANDKISNTAAAGNTIKSIAKGDIIRLRTALSLYDIYADEILPPTAWADNF